MKNTLNRKICVAPMLYKTNRHCRFLYRILSKHVYLYTEMISINSLNKEHIKYKICINSNNKQIALQIGGNNPKKLSYTSKIGEKFGYSEINLNCGCPSKHAQNGKFGIYLMKDTKLLSDCIKSMCDSVSIPITIKHRIGINNNYNYSFIQDFIGKISESGCKTFIIHARSGILNINTKKNRKIPKLKYDYVYKLKNDFPKLEFIINGNINKIKEINEHLKYVDGVMLGRIIYKHPYILSEIEKILNKKRKKITRKKIKKKFIKYYYKELSNGIKSHIIINPILGLYYGKQRSKHKLKNKLYYR